MVYSKAILIFYLKLNQFPDNFRNLYPFYLIIQFVHNLIEIYKVFIKFFNNLRSDLKSF